MSFRVFTDGLNLLRLLPKPVWFRYGAESGRDPEPIQVGFIAQDVQPIAPLLIEKRWTEPGQEPQLTIDFIPLVVMLVNAVNELDTQMQALIAQRDTSPQTSDQQ